MGKFMILDHIEIAKELELDYVYLGYWVPGSPKMDYKAQFNALELYIDGEWRPTDDVTELMPDQFDGLDESILEQVSKLDLPNTPIIAK